MGGVRERARDRDGGQGETWRKGKRVRKIGEEEDYN